MYQDCIVRLFLCSICCLVVVACHTKQGSFYRIERGDTLWRVAHFHDVEIEEIKLANPQLDLNHMRVGERIFIPGLTETRTIPKPKLDTSLWDTKKQTTSPKFKNEKWVHKKVDDAEVFRFQWPYRGEIISTFGMRNQKMHNGIDIQIPPNQMIRSSYAGRVVYAGDQIEGYDQIVIVLHDNHFFSIYAFLGDILVKKDQVVKTGEALAKPRQISPSFFHFEIRYIKTSLDPMRYLPK